MSFFDEADEPPTRPQTAPQRRRTGGGGRRPPSDQQAIQTRRLIAAGAALVLIVLIILAISSCQTSARKSSLKNYANSVASLIQQSDQTGAQLFNQLSGGAGGGAAALQTQIDQTSITAANQLSKARKLDVPGEMQSAHQNFVLAMQMRHDGITNIAREIQPALGTSTAQDATGAIAASMAQFYASDVVYKNYTAKQIASALHGAGLPVGGNDGAEIDPGQFLPDVQWLTPSFVAGKLGSAAAPAGGKAAPGTHGHSLDSVSVSGTSLDSSSTNTVPASPAPTFTLNLTNSGSNDEHNVVCKVTVSGTSVSGQTVLPQTTAGQSTSCNVQLTSAPPAGSHTVTATVQPVLGETGTTNNTQTFPVTFQ